MNLSHVIKKLSFSNPKKNQIVILHHNSYWIKKLILQNIDSTTIDHSESLPITPILIIRTLWNIRLICWKTINKKEIVKDFFWQLYLLYMLACIEQTKAKIVVTFIDNSSFFQRLSRADKKRKYFAIQNGTRTLACVRDSFPRPPFSSHIISMTNLFCFGQRDIDLFIQNGHQIDNYFPIGSLIGGYYKSEISIPVEKPTFDLCLISQWHKHFFEDPSDPILKRIANGIIMLSSFLNTFLKETNLNLVICTRFEDNLAKDEIAFYKNIFGEKVVIAQVNHKDFSTYRVVEQSKLAIALNSTVLLEVLTWGQKVLWCNINNDEHYEMPKAGMSYFCENNYNAFKERLLMLLKISHEDYKKKTQQGARYINNYNSANPPHKIIRSMILEILKTHS